MARLPSKERSARLKKAKELPKSHGGILLSTEYQGVDAKYKWRCAVGHEWDASYYSVVQRGQWCGQCSGHTPDKKEMLRRAINIARQRRGKCLSDKYANSQIHLKWRCEYGHEWSASFSNISRGKWCPWCAGNKVNPDLQLRKARETARSYGGKLLSATYTGNKAPMRWQCAEGHEWEASFSTVVRRRAWCGRCRGTQRDAQEQLAKAHEVAESKGGKCISKSYTNNRDPMEWECERGHIWKAPFYIVAQAGSWCPICSDGLKERLVRHTLEELFGMPFKKSRPDWLRNPRTGRLMELDGYNPELKLAFEYHGPQHYRVVLPFKMQRKHLEHGKYRDKIKNELCRKHGIALLEVPYTIETQEFPKWIYCAIEKRLDNRHLLGKMKDWRELQPREWVESEHYSIDDLFKYAKAKRGTCLSETYLGTRAKHRWRCAEGHEWDATWDSVHNQDSWCPICCGNIILNPLRKLQEIARGRGGKLVSSAFLGMHKKHRWRCSKGHEWDAKASHIKTLRSWCPVCSGHMLIAPLQQLRSIAEQRGGKCLSEKYVDSQTKLLWKCSEGHEWGASPSSIKSGRWCPICAVKKRIETRRKKLKR